MKQTLLLKVVAVTTLLTYTVLKGTMAWAAGSDNLGYSFYRSTWTAELVTARKATGDVVIPAQVEYEGNTYTVVAIGVNAFSGLEAVTSVVIPSTVTTIGESAFDNCKNLATISVSPNTVHIGSSAFRYTAWYNAQPDGPIYINYVLCDYKGKGKPDTSLVVKEGTVAVSPMACAYVKNITSVTLPTSIRWIESSFDYTGWHDNQPNGVLYINSVLYGYKGSMPVGTKIKVREGTTLIAKSAFYTFLSRELTEVTLPGSLRFIGEMAFYACSKLTSVVVPDGVKEIDEGAFGLCGLKQVELGSTLTKLGTDIFTLSSGLREIRSHSVLPPECQPLTFNGVSENCNLYIPKGTKDVYGKAIGWNRFKNIQEMGGGTDIRTEKSGTKLRILSLPGEIQIDTPDDILVNVHSMTGLLVYRGTSHRISLDKGVYVVTVGDENQKVAVY